MKGFMESDEIENLIHSIRLLEEFFDSDASRVAAWLSIPNPHLGRTRPIELFLRGRGRKVLQFIKGALEENEL